MIFDIEKGAEALLEFLKIAGTWDADVVSVTPEARVVIQYSFYHRESPLRSAPFQVVVGKFYADDMGHKTHRIMQELMGILSHTDATPLLAIPRPLFYDPIRRFLAQERVEGVPYQELLDHHDFQKYFRLAGKALALLHAGEVTGGQEKTIRDHLEELIHPPPLALSDTLPSCRPLVERVIHTLEETERGWKDEGKGSPIHRDFHLRQLFYGGERVWLIDWDLFARGDPALDVGNFVVYLKTHLTEKCSPAIDAFLEGYFSDRPSSILKRVPLYEAFTYLRLACKRLRVKGNRWQEKVKEMLLQGEQCLMKGSVCEKM